MSTYDIVPFVNPPQNTYYIACATSLLYEKLY